MAVDAAAATGSLRTIGTGALQACAGNDSRLSNSREWTASTVTQADAEAGISTTRTAWTAERVKQAIASLGPTNGVPSGTVIMTARSTAPSGFLLCDGSAVSRTTYAALFSAISTTWGSGDGSTTFNLPDMRGAAPAGAGTSTGYTQNETISVATKYDDQFQGHAVTIKAVAFPGGTGANGTLYSPNGTDSTTKGQISTDGVNGTPRTGNVTRGKRVGINFIIKT